MDDRILEKLVKLEEKNRQLPPLSKEEADRFARKNIVESVFYSNLLEGNTLSRKDATKAMFEKRDECFE